GASVQLKAQDGDVYLKLEYETSPGNWSRAQPHAYSWCGNSYFPEPEIGNDEFIVVRGHVPSDGEAATVRYALYGQSMKVHSNAGAGIVNQDEISKAANDAMAVKSGDFEFVSKVATGEIELKNEMDHITDLRRSAINTLARGEFDVESVRKTLMSIVETNDGTYSVQAGDVLKTLTERINEAEEKQPQK
ncbi:MAG TPA: hypothetical protein PK402_07205, partial [Tepidisphaeraceae bacterium]|nr:hypothetical protein [Tepidisphaeraceae bacterium]